MLRGRSRGRAQGRSTLDVARAGSALPWSFRHCRASKASIASIAASFSAVSIGPPVREGRASARDRQAPSPQAAACPAPSRRQCDIEASGRAACARRRPMRSRLRGRGNLGAPRKPQVVDQLWLCARSPRSTASRMASSRVLTQSCNREPRIGLRPVPNAQLIVHVGNRGIDLLVPFERLDRLLERTERSRRQGR